MVSGVFYSCQNNDVNEDLQQPESVEVSKDILVALKAAGVDPTDAMYENVSFLGGEKKKQLKVHDLIFDESKLLAGDYALATKDASKQYSTNNLVSVRGTRTITIIGFTGSGNALTSKMQTALQWAVNNYNRLNIGINFQLTFGTDYQDKDMVVYNNNQSGGGGSAGFPTGGNPYKFIQINDGTDSFSTNVNEHVITHEIGHCLGFRHTDYFNRSISCSQGGNEGDGGVGANLIPGTPTLDRSSIMLACFNSDVDGEFSSDDITALEYLY